MHQVVYEANQKLKNQPPPTPTPERCTGCNVKFSEDYRCEDKCPDCGYMACESCICHHSKGELRRVGGTAVNVR